MARGVALGVVGIGLLLLLVGAAMPSTTTDTATACDYAPGWAPGDPSDPCYYSGPVTVTTEEPNQAKFPTMMGGAILLIVGIALWSQNKQPDQGSGA